MWSKFDTYWIAVLKAIQPGGVLKATLKGNKELHFEGSGKDIRIREYDPDTGEVADAWLPEWQGQGAYWVHNPGESDEQAAHHSDQLFDRHECTIPNTVVSPVFKYHRIRGKTYATYLGARMITQSVAEYQFVSVSGYIGERLFGIGWGNGLSTGIAILLLDTRIPWPVPVIVLGLDIATSIFVTYQEPKRYSANWQGGNDINPYIALRDLQRE